MNTSLYIRAYTVADKAELVRLLSLNVPDSFTPGEIADYDHYLDKKMELYFIMEYQGILVGAGGINFELEKSIAKLSWDFLDPQHHHKGWGSVLLLHRLHLLKTMPGVFTIKVRTSQQAFRFYQKHGFIVQDIQADYWAAGYDLYEMIYPKS